MLAVVEIWETGIEEEEWTLGEEFFSVGCGPIL
jgi:hypothetical protein